MTLAELGAQLKEERMGLGLMVEDVAARLKVPARILRAIEEGDVNDLPHTVYTRGFIKGYGLIVGYPPEKVTELLDSLEDFDDDFSPHRTTEVKLQTRETKKKKEKKAKEKREAKPESRPEAKAEAQPEIPAKKSKFGLVLFIILLLILVGGGGYFYYITNIQTSDGSQSVQEAEDGGGNPVVAFLGNLISSLTNRDNPDDSGQAVQPDAQGAGAQPGDSGQLSSWIPPDTSGTPVVLGPGSPDEGGQGDNPEGAAAPGAEGAEGQTGDGGEPGTDGVAEGPDGTVPGQDNPWLTEGETPPVPSDEPLVTQPENPEPVVDEPVVDTGIAPPASGHEVVIVASAECWLRANADGGRNQDRTLRAGDTWTIPFERTLSLRLGRPADVMVYYDGQDTGINRRYRDAITLNIPQDL